VMREVWMEQVKTDPRVRYTDLSLWKDIDLSDRLGDVRQPVLVVAGAEDRLVAPDRQQDLCPQLPNSRMEVIDGAGHAVEVEQADAVADRIRAFVTSLARDVPL